MSALELKKIISALKEFTKRNRTTLEVILVGGLALYYYGMKNRTTLDIDAEITGNVEALLKFLRSKKIAADLGEAIERWSTVGMPPGYQKRATEVYRDKRLTIKILNPVDFIITKLRRFSEEDIKDALFVASKYSIKGKDIKKTAQKAIKNSPQDTMLFTFKKNLNYFLLKLR